jgi:hypothetical protein
MTENAPQQEHRLREVFHGVWLDGADGSSMAHGASGDASRGSGGATDPTLAESRSF